MSSGEHIGPGGHSDPCERLDPGDRRALATIADTLIPAEGEMPSPSAVGIADGQLDRMLAARPDLAEPLRRALAAEPGARDPEAEQALLLVIAGGYYTHPLVRERLGLTAAGPEPVRPEVVPTYVEEGLLDHLLEGGPRYRDPAARAQADPPP